MFYRENWQTIYITASQLNFFPCNIKMRNHYRCLKLKFREKCKNFTHTFLRLWG